MRLWPRAPGLRAALAICLAVGSAAAASASGSRLGPGLRQGILLVADRELADPNFAQSVILLVHYSGAGAVGLIVNRPSPAPLSEVLPDVRGIERASQPLYHGGPVSPAFVSFLVQAEEPPEGAQPVIEDVWVSSSRSLLERLLERDTGALRLYTGYAGWAAGQLDAEVARGGWILRDARAKDVFDPDPDGLWSRLVTADALLAGLQCTAGPCVASTSPSSSP